MSLTLDAFLELRGRDRRLARLTHDVALPAPRGLEFGAGANPTPLPEAARVAYVDWSREANADTPGAVAVDHVWSGAGEPDFGEGHDFAIASQVAQYVPDLLGWWRGIHGALRPGGVLNLSIPDRRFMFDVRRKVSTTGEIVEAFYGAFDRPSPRQAFDHTHGAAAVEPARLWAEDCAIADLPPLCGDYALPLALEAAQKAHDGAYVPSHCWVFTPHSFLACVTDLTRLRLFPFVISQFSGTEVGECEFFVCLRRDPDEDPDRLLAMQLGALDHVRDIVERRRRAARRLARE